jgi:hypothetical protein
MAWHDATPKGFAFRSTLGYVTDAGNDQFIDATVNYPTTTTIGGDSVTYGWETINASNAADRNTTVPRLAGIVYNVTGSGAEYVFRVDLPEAGEYEVEAAFGDYSFAQVIKAQIRDTASVLVDVVNEPVIAGGFMDANQVEHADPAAWVADQMPITEDFATTILRVALLDPSTFASTIAYLSVRKTSPVGGGSISESIDTEGAVAVAGQEMDATVHITVTSGEVLVEGQDVSYTLGGDIHITIDVEGVIVVNGEAVSPGFSVTITAGTVIVAGEILSATGHTLTGGGKPYRLSAGMVVKVGGLLSL